MRARSSAHFGALVGVLGMTALVLAGCGLFKRPPADDNAPTLASLAQRRIEVRPDPGPPRDEARAIAAYQAFLAAAPATPTQRAEAMRRLGDLEMALADKRLADGAVPDYQAAIQRYQAYLAANPRDAGNDRVLYQLARAQEQGGQLDAATATLDRLLQSHPDTRYRDEVEFRHGELRFTARQYAQAEAAYSQVLQAGAGNPLRDRALYMQGWSRYKQGRLEDALESFFGVLEIKLSGQVGVADDTPLARLPGLGRADLELLDDTFRVVSLSLESLQGAASIPRLARGAARGGYEYRVYEQLGELYLRQGRSKDAADTFAQFARLRPQAAQAPLAQSRVIGIYEGSGFETLALAAKKDFVLAYGGDSPLRRSSPQVWHSAQPRVQAHLAELAQHHHALAQKTRATADIDEAVRWYRAGLGAFGDDAAAPAQRFLLGELLFESGRHAEAVVEYERSAYAGAAHARSADSGYAALLAQGELIRRADPAQRPALQATQIDSALRFAARFAQDERRAAVLANAAETQFALGQADAASATARQLLALQPPAAAAQRRVAWTVLAHGAFDRQDLPVAERAYTEVLALVPEQDVARAELAERLAATIYRQGEAARQAGRPLEAVAHFRRVATAAPQSAVRANAQYDAAAAQLELKDWAGAARTLEDFRQRHTGHALLAEVPAKLALAYTEQGQWGLAAREFERLADRLKDPEAARAAQWQAAELHDKAGARGAAAKAYEAYLRRAPVPLDSAVEARWRLAQMAKADGRPRDELAWLKALREADAAGGEARTPRSRQRAALAAIALADEPLRAYRQVALVEPLQKSLKQKKQRFDSALQAIALAAETGSSEGAAAATFHSAALYQDFGRAVLASQRPRRLSKAEREQYDVMLEEQAFPFEERAVELHALNTQRTAQGLFDDWVRKSFAALRELRPLRYGKVERTTTGASDGPAALNAQGVEHREAGRFEAARAAYEQAIAVDARFAPAQLNLGILWDLYLHDAAQAMARYDAYQALAGTDATVARWIADLKNRKPQQALAAQTPRQP